MVKVQEQLHQYNNRIDSLIAELEVWQTSGGLSEIENPAQALMLVTALSKEIRSLIEQGRKNLESIDKSQLMHAEYIHKDELIEIIAEVSHIFTQALLMRTSEDQERADYAKDQLKKLLLRVC